MKYIVRVPEAQIPDGTKWLEGDRVIFSRQQNSSSANSTKWHSSRKKMARTEAKITPLLFSYRTICKRV